MVTADIKTEKGRGIAVYTKELSNGLKKAGLYIDQVFYKRGSFPSFFRLIPKLRNYDIVHLQHEYGLFGRFAGIKFILFLILLFFFGNKNLVITMHTVHNRKERVPAYIPLWSWIRGMVIYPIQNKMIGILAKKIITHVNFLSEILVNEYKINKEKLFVIPHMVENVFITKKENAKKQLGLKGPVYLMIGNITYQKGFDIVVKQARKIGKTILIVGDKNSKIRGGYLEKMEKFVKANKLSDIIRFDIKEGTNSSNDIWGLYFSAADLILQPSRTMTTSGIFINAIQYRKPIVGSSSTYFKEIHSKYGCIKIAKTEEDYPRVIKEAMKPKNYKKMEIESDRFAKENSIKILSKKYKSFYESIIKKY